MEWKNEEAVLYYEWHAKVEISQPTSNKLLELCEKHEAHLSKNSLKNESNKRFITARTYQLPFNLAQQRFTNIERDLKTNGFSIFKTITEACIFDSKESLDANWLTVKNKVL